MARVERNRSYAAGVDRITRLHLGDAIRSPSTGSGIVVATYYGPTNPGDIAEDIADGEGLDLDLGDSIPPGLTISDFAFSGSAADALTAALAPANATWFMEDGVLRVRPFGATADPRRSRLYLTPRTGLVGSPSETDTGVEVTMLLNPAIRRGSFVTVESESVRGTWAVVGLKHELDNREGKFETWADLRPTGGASTTRPGATVVARPATSTATPQQDSTDQATNPYNGKREANRDNRFFVVHTAESGDGAPGDAANVAAYFRSLSAPPPGEDPIFAAYHWIIDEATTLMFLDPGTHRAYHAIYGNDGIGIGFACNAADWPTMPASRRIAMLTRANAIIRGRLPAGYQRHPGGVPPPSGGLLGMVVAHGDIQGNRTDPGTAFPWTELLTLGAT